MSPSTLTELLPFTDPELVSLLHRATAGRYRVLRRLQDELGLTRTEADLVLHLGLAGEHRMGELATAMSLTRPSASRLVGQLEDRGLVERIVDPQDRRSVNVGLTAAAMRDLAQALQPVASKLERATTMLSAECREPVAAFLGRVAEARVASA